MNELLNLKNVVGFGNGFRTVKGERIGEATVVLVTKKLPLLKLAPQDIIPQAIDGNVTDVLEVGEIKALTYNHRLRPIQPGISIGHPEVTAGTLGAIVEDTHTGRKLILSNNHVIANSNDAQEGDPILQPGKIDGGRNPEDVVGNLFRFVPIQFGVSPPTCPIATGTATGLNKVAELLGRSHRLEAKKVTPLQANLVDAAVATIADEIEFNDEILDIGKINGTAEVSLGDHVQKTGRTTEHTTGQVLVVDASIQVSYGDKGSALFTNQIISGPMSAPGDSGSVVLDMQGNIVGLLFAGSEQVTIFNQWLFVASALRIGV